MQRADHQENRLILFLRQYRFTAIVGLVFGVLLYSLMMTQQLTNTFDGLWQQNVHQAGTAELSSGRWMLQLADRLIMGLHADPVASVLALALFILGFLLILDLFRVKGRFMQCLCLLLFLSAAAVCCTLSYRFTSFGYSLAYFLASCSVCAAVRIKNKLAAVGTGGVLLGLAMACYQAYLAVFCLVAVFYLIFLCGQDGEEDGKTIWRSVLRLACTLLVGAVFYIVSLALALKLGGTALSSYNGAGEVSVGGTVAGLFGSFVKTYRYFGAYFFQDELKINSLQDFGAMYVLLAMLAALLILIGIKAWKRNKIHLVILLAAAAVIPAAGNAYMLIAGDKLELQMTMGLAMLLPLTAMLAATCLNKQRLPRRACVILLLVLLYGNSMQVWVDQQAMYEGRNACRTMAAQVISDLQDEDLLSAQHQYFFVGVPAENPYFCVSDRFDSANGYARMGNFWVAGNCAQLSYQGLINRDMGFALPVSYQSYEDIAERLDAAAMPSFPEDGYITALEDGTVVIKISEYQAYTGHSKYAFPD